MERERRRQDHASLIFGVGAGIALSAVPGLNAIQMVGMGADFIDAYGYNTVLYRDTIDKIVSQAHVTMENATSALTAYIKGEDLSQEQLDILGGQPPTGPLQDMQKQYKDASPEVKKIILGSITAWAGKADPRGEVADDYGKCLEALDIDEINQTCKVDKYKKSYVKFWNENKDVFEKRGARAAQEFAENFVKAGEKEAELSAEVGEYNDRLIIVLIVLSILSFAIGWIVIYKLPEKTDLQASSPAPTSS
jgi:hypothetical protein